MNSKTSASDSPSQRLARRTFEHPWTQSIGWVTEQYESESHEAAQCSADAMSAIGWSIWIISNIGQPGFVVYRECGMNEKHVCI
jgi:hypothetical protein